MKPPTSLVPVAVTGGLVLGIACGERAAPSGRAGSALVALGLILFGGAWLVRGAGRAGLAVVGAAVLGIALGGQSVHAMGWPASFTRLAGVVAISGALLEDPDGHPFASSVMLLTDAVDGVEVERAIVVRASGRNALRLRALQMGDRVTVRATIVRLDSDDVHALRAGAVGAAVDAVIESFSPPNSIHTAAGAAVRRRIEQGARQLPERDQTLLLGFLLGDTRDIEQPTIDAFRAAGLTHLLAVSGANVAFVLALVGPMLRRLPTLGRFFCGLATVVVFAAATRFEPSVMRAATMAVVVMLARLSGRGVAAGRALAFAVFVLLVREPLLVHSLGFRLSVAATVGIVALSGPIAAVLRGPAPIRDALAITVAAELAVAPMLIMEFGSIPLLAPVANLLAVPAAEPLTIYGLLAAVVTPSLPPRLGGVLMAPCSWFLGWVRGVAEMTARVPLTVDARGLALLVVAGGLWWRRSRMSGPGDSEMLDVAVLR